LKALATDGGLAAVNMTSAVQDLFNKVLNDPTNNTYQYLDSNNVLQTLNLPDQGALTASTPIWVLQDLVNKWFLGVNYPTTTYGTDTGGGARFITPAYQVVTLSP
jgi:hypothetical protein